MFSLEPVAFDFSGDILNVSSYNDKLCFLMHMETGYKVLRVNLKNPEIIEDFTVSIEDDGYLMKLYSNILLLTDKKLSLVDLNIDYELETKMSSIAEYKDGYISVSTRGHVFFLQGTTIIETGLLNKLRNKSKSILKSVEIGSLPNDKGATKMIALPFPDNINNVALLFIQSRTLYQCYWDQSNFKIIEICKDVVDFCTFFNKTLNRVDRICVATSRAIHMGSISFNNAENWLKLQSGIFLEVLKISHCFLTDYFVGVLDDISKTLSIYWIPNPSVVDKIAETKLSDFKTFTNDALMNTYWLSTSRQLFEIISTDETKGLWRKYIEINDYEKALSLAVTDEEKDEIYYHQGVYLLSNKHDTQAAHCFSQMVRFDLDDIALLFLKQNSPALKEFLVKCIPKIHNKVSKILVLHWALYLTLKEMDDLRLKKLNFIHLQRYCSNLLSTYKFLLHKKTVYQLLESHKQDQLVLEYATSIKDFEYCFHFHILKKDYQQGIQTLQYQNDPHLIYSNISVLLQQAPKETIQLLISHPTVNPSLVIPAFIRHLSLQGVGDLDAIIAYLERIILKNNTTPVHNFLFSLYSQYCDEKTKIIPYLQGNRRFCDMEYALKQTEKYNKALSTITIFSELECHEDAVQLALSKDDIDLAKLAVTKVSDETELHYLWLKIAKFVVEKHQNINTYI